MLKQEKRRAAEAEAALAQRGGSEGSPSGGGAGALPLAGGRSADSGIQLDSSVRGSEGSTKASPQDSRESSAVCHTHRDTQTHTCMHSHANTHHQTRTLADLFPLRMVQAPALPVRSEQHCGQVHVTAPSTVWSCCGAKCTPLRPHAQSYQKPGRRRSTHFGGITQTMMQLSIRREH